MKKVFTLLLCTAVCFTLMACKKDLTTAETTLPNKTETINGVPFAPTKSESPAEAESVQAVQPAQTEAAKQTGATEEAPAETTKPAPIETTERAPAETEQWASGLDENEGERDLA